MSRARILSVAAAVAVVATACVGAPAAPPSGVTATTYCASSPPSSTADYGALFDGLRHAGTGWLSGDLAIPVALPDGRTAYLFGDTYVGSLTSSGGIDPSSPLIHNTAVVQNGACLTPVYGSPGRSSLIPSPGPGEWYWPSSAVVENGVLRVFAWHVLKTGSGPLDFSVIDMAVATFSLPNFGFQGVQPLPIPTSPTQPYGATALSDRDGYVYLYGGHQGNVYVARAPLGQIMTPSAWQFLSIYGTWNSSASAAVPILWANIPNVQPGSGPWANPWVRPYGTGYLATAKIAEASSDDVSVFTASSPVGPFTYRGQVASTAAPGVFAYDAYTQTLPGTSTSTVVYSTNLSAGSGVPLSGQTYGPHFVSPLPNSMP